MAIGCGVGIGILIFLGVLIGCCQARTMKERNFFHLKWNLYMKKKIKPKIRIYLQTDLNFFVKWSSVPFLQKLFSCLFKNLNEKNVILRGQIFWVMYIETKEKQIKDTEYISFSYNRWSKFIYLCVSLNFYPTKYQIAYRGK